MFLPKNFMKLSNSFPLHFLLGICVMTACGPAGEGSEKVVTEDTVTSIPEPPVSAVTALNGCYQMVSNQDTAGLQLEVRNDTASGELFYHWKEKDNNDGRFEGQFRDSLLVGHYRYRSEGVYSIRQIVFKISGDTLFHGNGELISTKDSFLFRDLTSLVFDLDHPFIKTACPNR